MTVSKSPSKLTVIGAAFLRRLYVRVAEYYGRRFMFYTTLGFGGFAALFFLGAAFITLQCASERKLTQGVHSVGRIVALDVRYYKKGRTYETRVKYTFDTPDSRNIAGSTYRQLHSKPALVPGGTINVLYDQAHPALNTMTAGLADDISEKRFGALLLTFCGLYFGAYVVRYFQWRRAWPMVMSTPETSTTV